MRPAKGGIAAPKPNYSIYSRDNPITKRLNVRARLEEGCA